MKKIIVLSAATAMLAVLSACACWSPINDTCVKAAHKYNTSVVPDAVTFSQVAVLPTKDMFRPTFTAGNKRITAIGSGFCKKQALNDAVSKLCMDNNCDMIAAAKAIVVKTRHPYWFFFHYSTYKVHLSGLPLTMTGLVKEIYKEPAPVKQTITKEDITNIVVNCLNQKKAEPKCVPAMLTLSDIKLNMSATAKSDSKVAVKLPAQCRK